MFVSLIQVKSRLQIRCEVSHFFSNSQIITDEVAFLSRELPMQDSFLSFLSLLFFELFLNIHVSFTCFKYGFGVFRIFLFVKYL